MGRAPHAGTAASAVQIGVASRKETFTRRSSSFWVSSFLYYVCFLSHLSLTFRVCRYIQTSPFLSLLLLLLLLHLLFDVTLSFLDLLLSDHDGALLSPDSVPEAQEGRARGRYQSASLNARSLGPQALSS